MGALGTDQERSTTHLISTFHMDFDQPRLVAALFHSDSPPLAMGATVEHVVGRTVPECLRFFRLCPFWFSRSCFLDLLKKKKVDGGRKR